MSSFTPLLTRRRFIQGLAGIGDVPVDLQQQESAGPRAAPELLGGVVQRPLPGPRRTRLSRGMCQTFQGARVKRFKAE